MAHLEQGTSHGLVAMSVCDWSDQIVCYGFLRFYESLSLANELLSKYPGSGRPNTLRNQRLGLADFYALIADENVWADNECAYVMLAFATK
jgi:hypothetical protein